MKLSTLTVLLGCGLALPQIYGLLKPAQFIVAARKFPRSEPCGYLLMALGTIWFLWNLKGESISDFSSLKPMMYAGFGLAGLLTCIYVSDFLAVRGLAITLLLLAKVMLDTQRWSDSNWKLVIAVWAYALIVAGIWFTISPWRLRDLIHWMTASEQRVRVTSAIRLAFALFVAILGLTVF